MNLFLSTRKLTSRREDHLTEFFAALLDTNQTFRQNYADFTLADFARKNGWDAPTIVKVRTQATKLAEGNRPDMLLQLADGHTILCEHKLDAQETEGSEYDPRKQLSRYLDLADGVLYVRSSFKAPDREVLDHPKYIKHTKRDHFLWRDFYCRFPDDNDVLTKWLKDGFKHLGFTPPHPSVGDLHHTDPDQKEANRRNFAKHWDGTIMASRQLGWRVESGAIMELYFDKDDALAPAVFVSPDSGGRFILKATSKEGRLDDLKKAMANAADALDIPADIEDALASYKTQKVPAVQACSTLTAIIGEGKTDSDVADKRLSHFVSAFLEALV